MNSEIQTLPNGEEALIVTNGTNIEVYPLTVIASYSELLGEPDPGKTVLLMRGAIQTPDQTGMWEPLYANLQESLSDLVKAGVPPEHMPDLMEEATGSPLPVKVKRQALRDRQNVVRERIGRGNKKSAQQNTQEAAEFKERLMSQMAKLQGARADFLETVAPKRQEPEKPLETEPPLKQEEKIVGRPTIADEETHGKVR